MLVLGIESTCDETAAALVAEGRHVRASVVRSQVDRHAVFGGVVPELASRLHLQCLAPCIRECLAQAGAALNQVDAMAVSNRPGLVGGLLVGTTMAKSLGLLLDKPVAMVDHLLGHLLSCDIVEDMSFPCIGGVFSGGHCNVYLGRDRLDWTLLARTRDDAPGEAFDKVAKLLGLPYPGGPAIQHFAGTTAPDLPLPSPLPRSLDGDFSFSGIKTAVLYHLRGLNGCAPLPESRRPALAASFQEAACTALVTRLVGAAEANGAGHIYVSGGVAANNRLRAILTERAAASGLCAHVPPSPLCMDNAAMIAAAGCHLLAAGCTAGLGEDVCSRSELGFVST